MNDSKFNVLLYSDGSHQAFSAAVYTATLLKKIPNMQLTILQVQESDDESQEMSYSWLELRPKYKRYHWGCLSENEYKWIDSWPENPSPDWMCGVLNESESSLKSQKQYASILKKTNEIYQKRTANVKQQILYKKTSLNESASISETVKMIIDYASSNPFELIIMGTRGLSTINGLIHGSLAHTVLDKSKLPVLLIKKLPQEFIDNYLASVDF
ncbi:universal stress protein family protein [Desulfosporosinus acididurans]|uniref:Universal stress protein family protein n=1 Tax=Desulfosporosinus acididurans TaxID=476652 RepID=A0A0J1FQF7_9FIRM|nr:universal stress protein [Desulfosporosinus acididurans]KLU65208.1 universal stress protein family protein [Desulfosporosinus acididurans]